MKNLILFSLFVYSFNLKAETIREAIAACVEAGAGDNAEVQLFVYKKKRFLRKPTYEIDSIWTNTCTEENKERTCESNQIEFTPRRHLEYDLANMPFSGRMGGYQTNTTSAFFKNIYRHIYLSFQESFDNNPGHRNAVLSYWSMGEKKVKLKCFGLDEKLLVRPEIVSDLREKIRPTLLFTSVSERGTWGFNRPCSLAHIRGTGLWQAYNHQGYFVGNYSEQINLHEIVAALSKVCKFDPNDPDYLLYSKP